MYGNAVYTDNYFIVYTKCNNYYSLTLVKD